MIMYLELGAAVVLGATLTLAVAKLWPTDHLRNDSWDHGFTVGVSHALSLVHKIPERLRGQTPISLHNVEVAVRKVKQELESTKPPKAG